MAGNRHIFAALLASSLIVGGCYDTHREPANGESLKSATTTIATLRSVASESAQRIAEPMIIRGHVTTSDKEGNFYRTLFVEDATGAIEILAGTYDLEATYPRGVEVSVEMQGCAMMLDGLTLKMGIPTGDYDYEPAEFQSPALLKAHIARGTTIVAPQPRTTTIEQLHGDICGTLIEVANVCYSPTAEAEEQMAGYHRFVDESGEQIYCYTSEYADFATQSIPAGVVTLRGILSYENVGEGDGYKWCIRPVAWSDIGPTADAVCLP